MIVKNFLYMGHGKWLGLIFKSPSQQGLKLLAMSLFIFLCSLKGGL